MASEHKREEEDSGRRPAVRDDWDCTPMPFFRARFTLRRTFSPEQMAVLRCGKIPQEMEDRWFWYMEGDTLCIHRSWSGVCVYMVEFRPDGRHRVSVNRKRSEYPYHGKAEELRQLSALLDQWSSPQAGREAEEGQ